MDPSIGKRIRPAILALASDPRPAGSTRLVGVELLYRIRIGDWRVVYAIVDRLERVTITRVAHRSKVYD